MACKRADGIIVVRPVGFRGEGSGRVSRNECLTERELEGRVWCRPPLHPTGRAPCAGLNGVVLLRTVFEGERYWRERTQTRLVEMLCRAAPVDDGVDSLDGLEVRSWRRACRAAWCLLWQRAGTHVAGRGCVCASCGEVLDAPICSLASAEIWWISREMRCLLDT